MGPDNEKTAAECQDKERKLGTFRRTEDDLRIKPAAYRDLLRNRDFLRLWSGQMISAIGDWVIVAVLFAYVNQLSGGKSYAISLMMLSKFLPAVLLGFLAGIIIDRLDRKNTLILCDLSRAALVLVLPFATNLAAICVLVFIMETFSIIYGPAKDASIPDLVEPDQLTNANSLNMVTLYASMAFGTAIAGSIIDFFDWLGRVNPGFMGRINSNKAAFVIDSLTFIVSAWLIYHIGFKKRSREERVRMTGSQVKQDFKEGFNYLRHHKLTRTILILTLTCFLGGGTIYVLTVGFVLYVLLGSNSTFMYILTTLLFGMMGGSVLAGVLKDRIRKERLLGLAIMGFGIGVLVFCIITLSWLSFVVAFAGGACMGYAIVGMVTLLHETLEEEYRGRAFATIQVIMRASIFLSIMVAGPLADLLTALGRAIGFKPISFWIFQVGGAYEGPIDGKVADFNFLINGPQTILFIGGIIILFAGLYGQRAFHRYFKWEGGAMPLRKKKGTAGAAAPGEPAEGALGGEPCEDGKAWEPAEGSTDKVSTAVEGGGAGGTAVSVVREEMEYLSEAEQAFVDELAGKAGSGEDPGGQDGQRQEEGGIPDGEKGKA